MPSVNEMGMRHTCDASLGGKWHRQVRRSGVKGESGVAEEWVCKVGYEGQVCEVEGLHKIYTES